MRRPVETTIQPPTCRCVAISDVKGHKATSQRRYLRSRVRRRDLAGPGQPRNRPRYSFSSSVRLRRLCSTARARRAGAARRAREVAQLFDEALYYGAQRAVLQRHNGNPLPDLLAGQVQAYFGLIPSSIAYIQTELRALAVTSATRSQALPDIPTMSEFVPGYVASGWYGIGAPKSTPAEIVNKLTKEIDAALADPR